MKAGREIPLRAVRDSIDVWPQRLQAYIDAGDGHFERSVFDELCINFEDFTLLVREK